MALPLYLAMTGAEMSSISQIPPRFAYMACHFSSSSQGLSNLPASLPEKSVLILNDNSPCQGHSPGLIADQLQDVVDAFCCESLLLDFQRPSCPESEQIIEAILSSMSVPVVISPGHGKDFHGPVFLPPCPLHVPLENYLKPWSTREIWLEAALCQEDVVVTGNGTNFVPHFPPQGLDEGFFDESLRCNYRIKTGRESVTFTLFDTAGSLNQKLSHAQNLGVHRAVGLWQELGLMYPL